MKIRTDIKEVKNRKSIEKINTSKSWLFEKVDKINQLLARLPKKNRTHKLLISDMSWRKDFMTTCLMIKNCVVGPKNNKTS